MRKLIVAAFAATSFFFAASAANAGYWWNGFYYPTCVYTIYGPVCGKSELGGWLRMPAAFHSQLGGIRELRRSSSALWSLPRADGASGRSHRRVQCHGGANERLQCLFLNLVALMEIDGTPGVAFEAGVEEA